MGKFLIRGDLDIPAEVLCEGILFYRDLIHIAEHHESIILVAFDLIFLESNSQLLEGSRERLDLSGVR